MDKTIEKAVESILNVLIAIAREILKNQGNDEN